MSDGDRANWRILGILGSRHGPGVEGPPSSRCLLVVGTAPRGRTGIGGLEVLGQEAEGGPVGGRIHRTLGLFFYEKCLVGTEKPKLFKSYTH